jgi:hypothetical protein
MRTKDDVHWVECHVFGKVIIMAKFVAVIGREMKYRIVFGVGDIIERAKSIAVVEVSDWLCKVVVKERFRVIR